MRKIIDTLFTDERSLFKSNDLLVEGCTFKVGESPLKESKNILVKNCTFQYKYPLWYCDQVDVSDSTFEEMSRSGIWYTKNIKMNNCNIIAQKEFRRGKNITIENTIFHNASETLWMCENISIQNVTAKGDYLMMNCKNIEVDSLTLDGNYVFDGSSNITVKNSKLYSKDSFWNCKDVTVIDSEIIGEFIGWNSENITFINCHIESWQGFCYIKNLKLINCSLKETRLAFEYSTVDVDCISEIDSVKNPYSGTIKSKGIKELILEPDKVDVDKIRIISR